jgi:hypothetical protein
MRKTQHASNTNPAEKAMKQSSKTEAERGGDEEAPVGPNDGPGVAPDTAVSPGDAPVGRSDNDGSSPYEEPNHLAKKQRSN